MTLPERLKAARESLRMSQKDMAKAIGIAYTSWLGYEDGANVPGGKVLEALARQGIDLNWLMVGEGEMKRPEWDERKFKDYKPGNRIAEHRLAWKGEDGKTEWMVTHPDQKGTEEMRRRQDDRFCYIPLYDVKASAGGGVVVDREDVVDTLAFKKEWIRTQLNATQQDLYLIHVEGESMEPTLRPGDLILVDHREAEKLPRDGVYVVRMDDSLLVKRLQRLPGGQVRVTSDNTAYQPFMINLTQQNNEFDIVGRVVWCGRRM